MTVVALGAAWRPVQNHSGPMTAHLGLVLHVQAGNGGLSGWFNNPAAQASSTWWVSKGGVLEQYVDADVVAWAQASGNSTYNSVETEGFPTEPLTPAQEHTLANLYRWGADRYGWPMALAEQPGQRGFAWHGMGGGAWGGHVDCPGPLRRDRRAAILALAGGGTPTAPSPPPPTTPPTGAPPFPWPPDHYIGTPRADPRCHSGHYGPPDSTAVMIWQRRMIDRGWRLAGGADGDYGVSSQAVCRAFQAEKGLAVDGLVGPVTWAAAWTTPVT